METLKMEINVWSSLLNLSVQNYHASKDVQYNGCVFTSCFLNSLDQDSPPSNPIPTLL